VFLKLSVGFFCLTISFLTRRYSGCVFKATVLIFISLYHQLSPALTFVFQGEDDSLPLLESLHIVLDGEPLQVPGRVGSLRKGLGGEERGKVVTVGRFVWFASFQGVSDYVTMLSKLT